MPVRPHSANMTVSGREALQLVLQRLVDAKKNGASEEHLRSLITQGSLTLLSYKVGLPALRGFTPVHVSSSTDIYMPSTPPPPPPPPGPLSHCCPSPVHRQLDLSAEHHRTDMTACL